MNSVLYARVSTQEQAETDLSIPAQLQAMREYAQQRDWNVVDEFIEPGASGRNADRPSLQRMLSAVKSKDRKIDVVLVHKIDRLARNLADHATIRALLKRHQVRLASVVENMDDSVSGQLVENIMASIAEFYSANLSDEVKKGMRQMVVQGGWPHRPPKGYLIIRTGNDVNGVIAVHPDDGPLIRLAFELYATGAYSVASLADRLAMQGLTNIFGKPLAHAHLRRILENSFYRGNVRWHGTEYAGQHPALVSAELFTKVQGVIKDRITNPGPRGSVIPGFVLRGLAICIGCRGRMTCERHGKWRYYRCSRQTYRRELCQARMCNADRAHAGIERICRSVRVTRELAAKVAIAAESIIQARLTEAQSERAQIGTTKAELGREEIQLSEGFAAGAIPSDVYKSRISEIRARLERLTTAVSSNPHSTAVATAHAVMQVLQVASSLWDIYQPLSEAGKSSLLKTVFGTIVLGHDGLAGHTLRPPFDTLTNNGDASPRDLANLLVGRVA